MEETATEIKDEKLSFVIDGEEFWTRKGVMNVSIHAPARGAMIP